MIELSTVLNTLATIWALVGCMLGLYILICLVEGMITGALKSHIRRKHERE